MSTPATTARTRGVLVATCLSTLVVNANTSAVSILLPAISEDTGMSVDTLQWAVTGYSLVGAAVIVTSGSLGDVFGRKRVFQLGLLLFVASCVLIALSTTGGVVIAGRFIQGAAGSTILACGLSLLTLANSGQAQTSGGVAVGRRRRRRGGSRPPARWRAGGADRLAGPLLGRCSGGHRVHHHHRGDRHRVPRPHRSRSIDFAGSVLVALTLAPLILALSKGSDWGWTSLATLGSLAVSIAAGFGFVAVERRVSVPLLDLGLLRNRVLVGATVAILIGAGTINALMYLLSLYFQNPAALGFSPLQAGLATLPATAGLVAIAAIVPRLAAKFGGRRVVGAGFALTAVGFAAIGFTSSSWSYVAFVLPLVAIAVGMGMSNGPASSAATASVPANQVGEASGVSNMARYVGAAVATALAASIYGSVIASQTTEGESTSDALASGLATASWLMAAFSVAGVVMAVVMGRHHPPRGTLADAAASAAAVSHTLPTTATSAAEPLSTGS